MDTLEFGVDPNGIVGAARHSGNITLADVRTPSYQRRVDTVLNRQSVSFVGGEDLDYIAGELELDPRVLFRAEALLAATSGSTEEFDRMVDDLCVHKDASRITRRFLARCLGANVLLGSFQATDEVQDFRSLTPGTDFGPYDVGTRKFTDATVMITRPNGPCIGPGKKIQANYPGEVPDLAKRFVVAAQGRRGFVGMVAKSGNMAVGQSVGFVPLGE